MGDVRSAEEVDEMRERALSAMNASTAYRATVGKAVVTTLDWLSGARGEAPATGDLYGPDDVVERSATWRPSGLVLETLRAADLENLAVQSREYRPNLHWYGAVWKTLQWYRRLSDDPPLY